MKKFAALVFLSLAFCLACSAHADTFGSGANTFEIEFVTIGNPGNPADPTGNPNLAGKVDYAYRIGKYEISELIIDKANVLAGLGISHDFYGADKPAWGITWNEAARFVNWMNASKGFPLAYKFALQPGDTGYDSNANILLWDVGDTGYDPANLFRNRLAKYVLPSTDEWYKAAYYDPNANAYYDYPTGSNTPPTSVVSGTASGTAVYFQSIPADITLAGGLSPYGTMAQGGNMWEWQESASDGDEVNDNPVENRSWRGGIFFEDAEGMIRLGQGGNSPTDDIFGFRVAARDGVDGDFDLDGDVDGEDFLTWQRGELPNPLDSADLTNWAANYGSGRTLSAASTNVPEPTALLLGVCGCVVALVYRHDK